MHYSKTGLDRETIERVAPSVYTTTAHPKLSDRYRQVNTSQVVDALREVDYIPVAVGQSNSRNAFNQPYTKHLLRFRSVGDIQKLLRGEVETVPEIVAVNGHDGITLVELYAGIFRMVCENGLISMSSSMVSLKLTHRGDINLTAQVVEMSKTIAGQIPLIYNQVASWQGIKLDPSQQRAYAVGANDLRSSSLQIAPEVMLTPRRTADAQALASGDLWTTFNVVQENLTQGGLKGIRTNGGRYNSGRGRGYSTMAVKSVDETVRLNQALWQYTDSVAQMVTEN